MIFLMFYLHFFISDGMAFSGVLKIIDFTYDICIILTDLLWAAHYQSHDYEATSTTWI